MSARTRFPAGLEQPAGSLRFGADALLLAAFVARHVEAKSIGRTADGLTAPRPAPFCDAPADSRPVDVAELGSGCGAALLALALRCPQINGMGLEREEPLVQAARHNARLLGLCGQTRFAALDIGERSALSMLVGNPPHVHASPANPASPVSQRRIAGSLHIVLTNPPYDAGGRPSPQAMRERALRGDGSPRRGHKAGESTLDTFCRAAAMLLRHRGYFFCIHDARALPQLCVALHAARLGVRRILPVHARAGGPALRVLVEARKGAAHDTVLEAPLYLHGDTFDGTPHWTDEALLFCPWLRRDSYDEPA